MFTCRTCGKVGGRDARFCAECGSALTLDPPPERRGLATVLECDVRGSTALGEQLDAESVRGMMLHYFHTMRSAIERHGGTVEKFIGDAVVAVFGVPTAHEDDALRACRAAVEMRERMVELNDDLERRFGATLALRIGLYTSEVVAGDASTRETFVAGEAPNLAARLEAAAQPGEILLGDLTRRLAGRAVRVEALAPIAAKGKAQPVAAYRLVSVTPGSPPQRPTTTPLVGRRHELDVLERRFDSAVAGTRCVLATIVGEPGVGKSRLAGEVAQRLSDRAQILTGRCLSYGEGITYWPLAEIVRSAAGIRDEDSPEHAKARLDRLAENAVVQSIAFAIGLEGQPAETGVIASAFRKLFEVLARKRPLLLLVEDVHWAEATLLNLLSTHMTRAEAPILLLSTARPELLERSPRWPGPIMLESLPTQEADQLVQHLPPLPPKQRERMLGAAGGNPLFLEELNAFLREHPDERELPPSLSALLAARLDRLPDAERAAAERGSVEGELFHRGSVSFLSLETDRARVRRSLDRLVARRVIRPAPAAFANEAAFRFKHVLVRDAAYNGTAKKLRAELHERLAKWLERAAGDRVVEIEEILGYHLEQAYRYRNELGPIDEHGRALARRAGEWLASAGQRASDRTDLGAARALLSRAVDLLPEGHTARPLANYNLALSIGYGTQARERAALLEQAAAGARAAGDRPLEWRARLQLLSPTAAPSDVQAEVKRAIFELEELGDDTGLAIAWEKLGHSHASDRDAVAALERALLHAERAGDERLVMVMQAFVGIALNFGTTPVSEVISRLEATRVKREGKPALRTLLGQIGYAYMLAGRLADARGTFAQSEAMGRELGNWWSLAGGELSYRGTLELLAGDPVAAEQPLREAYDILVALDDEGRITTITCELAEALCEQGRYDEAEDLIDSVEAVIDESMILRLIRARKVRAILCSRRRQHARAEASAREAVGAADSMDGLVVRGEARLALAEVLFRTGGNSDGERAIDEAMQLFDQKGAVAWMRKARNVSHALGTGRIA